MSRRLTRISLTLVLLLSGEVWAIGLGDIRLDSALNEPLRAEIELLSANTWTVNDAYATNLQNGRVFIMGDAAHRHPPAHRAAG